MARRIHSRSTEFWRHEAEWFVRNHTAAEIDERSRYVVGHRRLVIWRALLRGIPRNVSVLEVGSGAGIQLSYLERLGFQDLHGCDINDPALQASRYPGTVCDANALPFPDASFDLVMTSGLLIHISPLAVSAVVAEIARVSRRWVAGYEYHAHIPTAIEWRGCRGLLWKADYPKSYEQLGLRLAKLWLLPHIDGSGNVDSAFLLTK